MIKSELITRLSCKQDHLSAGDVALCTNATLNKISSFLSDGGRVEIRDFGSWSQHYRPPRCAHNPKTGEKFVTPPKYALHFKPGKAMKNRVNAARATIPIKAESDS